MTRDEFAQFLSQNLLTTVQFAEELGLSKQLLSNYIKAGRIEPILVTTQGNLFLRTDIDHFRVIQVMEYIERLKKRDVNVQTRACVNVPAFDLDANTIKCIQERNATGMELIEQLCRYLLTMSEF